jgi:SAM-dependent methyltransferase
MSVEVLTTSHENARARAEMIRRGLNLVSPWYVRAMHKVRIVRGASVGDVKKSWDVLRTVDFIEKHVDRTSPILDIGAYASEVLCVLHKMGFSNLTGIDLDARLSWMPHADAIRYVDGDFTRTSFAPASFKVITAVSVLEHGFRRNEVLAEMSRILMPGGYFVGSIDYWPEKIDTSGIKAFGLEWNIFSEQELVTLVDEAAQYGMLPIGKLNFQASERPITWLGRAYTFAWFAFRKGQE